jgi:hypothetical protein
MKKMVVSRITVWFSERGYGFLRPGGQGDEENLSGYFLHQQDILSGIPARGSLVRFELLVRKKGSAAINAEVFQSRQEMERADAVAALNTLVKSTAPTVEVSAEVERGE